MTARLDSASDDGRHDGADDGVGTFRNGGCDDDGLSRCDFELRDASVILTLSEK